MNLPVDLNAWDGLGFVGQVFFGSRFIVQWLVSERKGRSHVPVIFWYLSLVGGIMLTIYAFGLARPNLVFGLAQGLGVFIYLRNLVLIKRHQRSVGAGGGDGTVSDR